MTQLDDGHDYLHAKNKDKMFKEKQMQEYKEAYVVVKSEPINKDLDMHPMYKAEDATVVFKNRFGKLYKVDVPRLIRVFNNNIWQNKKSVK
mgnify:FL=1|tara:strand:+ start:423 stop:695 length:273 start_codon:yes stop_codon:yes gene_type:complete